MALNLFVPLDVDYQDDPKIIEAGASAECLFVRSMALSKRTLSDGQIHASQLSRLAHGIPGPAKRHAQRLVDVGLWVQTKNGWAIKAWLKRNASAATVTANSEARAAASALANHQRWHVGENGKPKVGCPHCSAIGVRSDSDSESIETEEEVEPQTEEETEPSSSSSALGLTLVPNPTHDDDRIAQAIDLHAKHASTGKGTGYARTIRTNDPLEHGEALTSYLERWPDATPAELAHHVLGVPIVGTLPDRKQPRPEYPHCDECANVGWKTMWALDEDGHEYSPGVEPCHCPRGQALKGTA